jgi:DNA (cytosine-5)-methyltransferase 1
METQTYTVRANKGKPRIWLEGKRLAASQFKQGTRYTVEHGEGYVILTVDPEGKRKVSGKPDRPIVDLMGKACGDLDTGTFVVVAYTENKISILS